MNAVTMIERPVPMGLAADMSFEQWVGVGRNLADMHDHLGFMIGDWFNHGRAHFAEQMELALGECGLSQKFVSRAARIAERFPEHCRSKALSFDHHRAVAKLPSSDGMDLLRQAETQHWKVQELREAVVQRRYEIGDMFEDEDVDYALSAIMIRAWNRGTPAARRYFLELAQAAKFDTIDEEPTDADAAE